MQSFQSSTTQKVPWPQLSLSSRPGPPSKPMSRTLLPKEHSSPDTWFIWSAIFTSLYIQLHSTTKPIPREMLEETFFTLRFWMELYKTFIHSGTQVPSDFKMTRTHLSDQWTCKTQHKWKDSHLHSSPLMEKTLRIWPRILTLPNGLRNLSWLLKTQHILSWWKTV